ncbi:MAG: DNA alkylation repair protein [Clostridia bacterium]|nr:DNA alkylation repair protein [Clostridia bacterium]
MNIIKEILTLQDIEYKNFHQKLMPTINPDRIIGVRVPALRKLAKDFYKSGDFQSFLSSLPHKYYEENNIHAFLIEQIKDYDKAIYETENFLPYIDNWATCDMFQPKIFKKHKKELLERIKIWIKSEKTYTVRYAINQLMTHFLDEDFNPEFLKSVADVKSDEYYINMMRAWYFATALAKQYDATLPYITNNRLDKWTHNKTIQKAVESNRISKDTKVYLKSYKI